MILHRFRAGLGERLEITVIGAVVTWRVVPLGHDASPRARTEIAADAEAAEHVAARVELEYRGEGFVDLGGAELTAATRTIEPHATWCRLSRETFADHFAYLDAPQAVAALASRLRAVEPLALHLEFDGGMTLTFGMPIAYEPAPTEPTEVELRAALRRNPGDVATRTVYADWLEQQGRGARAEWLRHVKPNSDDVEADPEPLRPYWRRHAMVWANRGNSSVVLGRHVGPPEPPEPSELDGIGVAQWVMSNGYEQFWFLADDGTLRLYDLDGGVREPIAGSLGALWLDHVTQL